MTKYFVIALLAVIAYFHFGGLKALVIGDSLSTYKNGWQDVVCSKNSYTLTNISRGGKRTTWMLTELKAKLDTSSYDKVYIYGGINDMFSSVKTETAVNNIQEMVNVCLQHNTKPVVIIGYDPSKVCYQTGYKLDIEKKCRDRYIEFQKQLALSIKGAKIIPMDTTVTRKDSNDGIHLNSTGHRKFTKWIIEHE